MKVHEAIGRALADQGAQTIFGVLGDANLFFMDSFVRHGGGRFVSASNEAGATLMAIGHAAVSGQVGVATVTLGPGVSNTVSALLEGVRGNVPLVLLAGDTGDDERDEISRLMQREMITVTGAGFEQVRSPATVFEDVSMAFWRARVERRPVALNIRRDFQWADIDYQRVVRRLPEERALVPNGPDLEEALGIVASAKRPLVLAGRGVVATSAAAAVAKFARRIEAPLATTMKAKDLFHGDPDNLGVFGTMSHPGSVDAILASDCVIAFGAGLNHYTTSKGVFLRGKRVVQVNRSSHEIGRFAQPTVGMVGDPELTAALLTEWLDTAEIPPSGFTRELHAEGRLESATAAQARLFDDNSPVDLAEALCRINRVFPKNRIVITDGGRFLSRAWMDIDVFDPRYFVYTLNYGSIGMGLPEAVGAAVACADRPALLVTGDGGFMLGGLAEFSTAVRHGCDLVVVVCNDSSYGAEDVQLTNRGMDPSIARFSWPDFAPVAVALGGQGVTVRTMGDLQSALDAIEARQGPLLIDLKLDPDTVPPLGH